MPQAPAPARCPASAPLQALRRRPPSPIPYFRHLGPGEWVREEGHLACVFRLAERVAFAAAIDQMRVDIFVEKGNPDACMVNENSLSSGSDTWPHRMYVARLWAEGHERHLYTAFGNASGKPSYMQTEADVP